MEFADIQNYAPLNRALGVGRLEFTCIIETLGKYCHRDFDLVGLLHTVFRLEAISKDVYSRLHNTYARENWDDFCNCVIELLSVLPYDIFCFVFEIHGYKDFADELRVKRFNMLYKYPPKCEMLHSRRTHEYYKTLKSCVDNDAFEGDKKLHLQKFIDQMNTKITNDKLIQHDRQYAMERKVAATVVFVTLQTNDYVKRRQILDGAIRAETNGLDNTSLQIVYHSKMALTEAQAGHVAAAEEHIIQTKQLCANYGPCFAVTVALHDIEYIRRTFYLINPTEDNLEKVLTDGDLAMQSVQNNEESVRNLWQRIMLLFMALSLLSITPDFVVGDTRRLKKKHIKLAEHILKGVNTRSDNIEHRRKMIVSLCQAVVYKSSDIKLAENYAKQSLTAADAGGCYKEVEKKNIQKFLSQIQRKQFYNEFMQIFKWFSIIIVVLIAVVVLL